MTPNRFGYEWQRWAQLDPFQDHYREQFLNWIWPYTDRDLKGKTILDAGCGMGRNSYWCCSWDANQVVAFDVDPRTIASARQTLSSFSQAQVYQHSIYQLPWHKQFDFVMSIGVIHHLADPASAISALVQTLKPGGELLIWVYGESEFKYLLKALQPIRHYFTSKLPLPILHFLTYGLSLPLYAALKLLPIKHPYLKQLKRYRPYHIHGIVFDQLLPPIAHYYTKDQAKKLLSGLSDITITAPPNNTGWIVRGFKPPTAPTTSAKPTVSTISSCDQPHPLYAHAISAEPRLD